jgi:hypothetical protein
MSLTSNGTRGSAAYRPARTPRAGAGEVAA